MTNFEAINEFRLLIRQHGYLVPELTAHKFAGCARQTWNGLRRRGKVPVVYFLGDEYVSLEYLEKRNVRPGRVGIITHLRERVNGKKIILSS
jgi:hypothetical protein